MNPFPKPSLSFQIQKTSDLHRRWTWFWAKNLFPKPSPASEPLHTPPPSQKPIMITQFPTLSNRPHPHRFWHNTSPTQNLLLILETIIGFPDIPTLNSPNPLAQFLLWTQIFSTTSTQFLGSFPLIFDFLKQILTFWRCRTFHGSMDRRNPRFVQIWLDPRKERR